MADISHRGPDIAAHPDVAEMRARYARIDSRRGVVAIDGGVLLVGLYAAISSAVVHFRLTNPDLHTNNLILGLALAVFGLCLTLAPERTYRLSGVVAVIGVWMIISPWVVTVGHTATAGIIWNNVLIGAVCCLLGLAAMGMAMELGPFARK